MKYHVVVKFHKDFVKVEKAVPTSDFGRQAEITVGILARPEKGKANEELIKKIAAHFHVAQSRVRIVTGARSKRKTVEIL